MINPNGVLVGEGANINTAEFIASALDVADSDFLDGGDLTFAGQSDAAVINLGQITADNGDVILIAQVVENAGELNAENGTAGLAAGGNAYELAINQSGIVRATGVTQR